MDDPQPLPHSTPDYDDRGWDRSQSSQYNLPEMPSKPVEPESRLNRLLERTWKYVQLAFVVGMVVAAILDHFNTPYSQPISIIFGGVLLLYGLWEAIRWFWRRVTFFSRLQKRTAELLATIFFGGTIAAIAASFVPHEPLPIVAFMVVSMAWAFAGSTWAWQILEQMKENDTRARLGVLLSGWMGIPGIFSIVIFSISLIALIVYTLAFIKTPSEYKENVFYGILWTAFGSAVFSLLALPAYKVQKRWMRRGYY